MRWVLDNWQIKLVALSLAVALWFYTSGQARVERTLTVSVAVAAVRNLPAGARIAEITPREFTVEVDGPMIVLQELRSDPILPRLDLAGGALDEGRQDFPITNQVLGLPADVRIQRINPSSVTAITVTLGRVIEKEMLVEAPELEHVPAGLAPNLNLEESRLLITGPENALKDLLARHPRLRFLPVSLKDANPLIDQPTSLRVTLVPDVPASITVPPVHAVIVLKPVDAVRQQVGLPVHLLAQPDFLAKHQVQLSQPQVVMTVRGPRNLIATLTPATVAAYVDLRRPLELNQPQEVTVEILGPPWLTADPVTLRVTISLIVPRTNEAPSPALDAGPDSLAPPNSVPTRP